jgi:hypothetical protein
MKYAIEGFTTQATIDFVESSPIKKFIDELNFKYGLKVLDTLQKNENYLRRPVEIVLTDATGTFVVARAWVEGKNKDLTYYLHSPYYRKDRGHGSEDKETTYSKKLPSLMGTIKRNDIIPNERRILTSYEGNFSSAIHKIVDTHGRYHKNDELSADDEHALLKFALGETTELNILDKCKKLLDKYNSLDKIKNDADADVQRFFGDGFYAIGADSFNHLVIGTLKHNMNDGMRKYEIVKPFERVKDLSNHEHLQPIMLMQKVYNEGKVGGKFWGNYIPQVDGYLKDLDIVQISNYTPSYNQFVWTFISCSSI